MPDPSLFSPPSSFKPALLQLLFEFQLPVSILFFLRPFFHTLTFVNATHTSFPTGEGVWAAPHPTPPRV